MILTNPRIHGLLRAKGLSPHPITKECESCHQAFETRKLVQKYCSQPCQKRHARINQASAQLSEYGRFKTVMTFCTWGCVGEDGAMVWGPQDLLERHRQVDHPDVPAGRLGPAR